MEKINFSLDSFKNVQELIRFTDQKAGAILVAYGFILTIFIECSKDLTIINPFKLTCFNMICSIGTFIFGLALIINMVYQMYFIITQIIKPRLCSNYLPNELSLFYFDHISKMTKEKLLGEFKDLTENKILDEVLGQLYEVAKIASSKTKNICIAINYLCLSIVLLFLFILSSRILVIFR